MGKEQVKKETILEANNITKVFPGVHALDNVSIDLKRGEVHALVGENGAGKSTLIKILAGLIPDYKGEIFVNGKFVRITNPIKAYEYNVGLVSQDLNMIHTLSVEQNLFLGREPLVFGMLADNKTIRNKSVEILKFMGINVKPYELLGDLSVGQQQMIAIARSLLYNPQMLLLDEPTSSLTSKEIAQLFKILRDIKKRGVSIVYVSHKLEEVFKIADRVTVLRDGRKVETKNINELSMDVVVKMMVGREISEIYPKESPIIGKEALILKSVSKGSSCRKINLVVHEGEVVGLYGLIGAGRTELARLIFGMENMDEGEIYILGKKVTKTSPSNLIEVGLGFLTEDRVNEGLCMNLSVKRNINRVSLNKIFPKGFISYKKEDLIAKKYVNDLNIKTPSVNKSVMFLSGGNQQKVMFAHWMTIDPKILILDEPTKGVDVGARLEIYKMINSLKKKGVAILLISSDLSEIIGMSDKVYVMYKGKMSGYFDNVNNSITENIASCAIGKETNEA